MKTSREASARKDPDHGVVGRHKERGNRGQLYQQEGSSSTPADIKLPDV